MLNHEAASINYCCARRRQRHFHGRQGVKHNQLCGDASEVPSKFTGFIEKIDGIPVNDIHKLDVLKVLHGQGNSTKIQGRLIEQGAKLGVKRIDLIGSRTETDVGYVVWPIMGYDGPLPVTLASCPNIWHRQRLSRI